MSVGHQRIAQAVLAALAVTSFYSVTAIAQEATASGEVRRIDAQAGKITIKHGQIPALDLTAMTLVYRIDPALLSGIKPGDKVKFTARREAGQYVVVAISK
ncbi:MAG TPA: copper-binding protein [Burkholderiaceae bacterium]|nr:copper-binding protein [Burkholderiaceae bacterium]